MDTKVIDDSQWHSLISWSKEHFSTLPWRVNRSLYHTLISEFMLQQTTVATVIPKFKQFCEKYPSWDELSQASTEDILVLWSGLGYYQRARRLKALCESTTEQYFIENIESKKWEGIGPYTKNALLSLALDRNFFALDANLNRIFSRLKICPDSSEMFSVLKNHGPRVLNEALMDLGRVYCKAHNPKCTECLLKNACPSAGKVPIYKKKSSKPKIQLIRFIVPSGSFQYLGLPKSTGQWIQGFIELPTFSLSTQERRVVEEYPLIGDYIEEFIDLENPLQSFTNTITKYRFLNSIYLLSESKFLALLRKSNIENIYRPCSREETWSGLSSNILSNFDRS